MNAVDNIDNSEGSNSYSVNRINIFNEEILLNNYIQRAERILDELDNASSLISV